MNKIAVLGGGFNPPHLGHYLLCQQILNFTSYDEVWLMPYYEHPWGKPSIDVGHRLRMCSFMENSRIKISTLEIESKKKNFTYETIILLTEKFPKYSFGWIIGSDLLPDFFKWEGCEEIIKSVELLIFPRAGFPILTLPQNSKVIEDSLLSVSDVSSDKIREMVRKNLSIQGLVLPEVEKYIKENNLYK